MGDLLDEILTHDGVNESEIRQLRSQLKGKTIRKLCEARNEIRAAKLKARTVKQRLAVKARAKAKTKAKALVGPKVPPLQPPPTDTSGPTPPGPPPDPPPVAPPVLAPFPPPSTLPPPPVEPPRLEDPAPREVGLAFVRLYATRVRIPHTHSHEHRVTQLNYIDSLPGGRRPRQSTAASGSGPSWRERGAVWLLDSIQDIQAQRTLGLGWQLPQMQGRR